MHGERTLKGLAFCHSTAGFPLWLLSSCPLRPRCTTIPPTAQLMHPMHAPHSMHAPRGGTDRSGTHVWVEASYLEHWLGPPVASKGRTMGRLTSWATWGLSGAACR